MILAVDTSIGSTVAVIGADGSVHARLESESPRGHAEVIGDLLARALADARVAPDAITHVAAGMGPGPFTGLRIGIAAARAFAIGRGIPLLPVVSHDAAALTRIEDGGPERFAVVTDARRRENAVSVYEGVGAADVPRRTSGPELLPQAEDLAARFPGAEIVHVGAIDAARVGRIAARRMAAGLEPDVAEPLYLRSPDVVASHSPKRVSA
ncbi:tRNA (adenosine(37)-N6)-threonylcarbamoyltransferase complex dimerization subunit type 1 TsaB [Microbacterium sp. Marseille-Q6965]|uniref:tRNA (adenosine(37)-N6)-threonylcarbamoyltransferase complex dimerization subunit type 1 TsaB n=1 Tax=Microbacterium sp. Marseille-Q6965 TaxID=2965072 RepID=UPI0021B73626|nr:tRNA (adenosine(37)-N6)-threonylcarbamoyltransferase complex dimerization subunit type 1 TsaB [Microbacterium sp. Marseille-Q6965]